MGVAKVEYYGRTLIDLTGDSVNPDVLGEGETAHDANGDLIVGRGVLNKGNFANALVGNVSGEIVAMDDVSPLEHKISVKVRSKNVIPFPYNDIDKTTYGITFNVNTDGSIVLNGTSTNLSSFNLYHPNQNILIPFEAGVSYRIGATGERKDDVSLIVYYEDETGANKWATDIFTWQNNFVLKLIYIQVNSVGKTFDNYTAYPIIAKGTTVPTFAPCIANDEVITVKSCGKNLFDISLPKISGTSNVIERDNNKIVVQNATVETRIYTSANFKLPNSLVGKTVTFSADAKTSDINKAGLRIQWGDNYGRTKGDMIISQPEVGQTGQVKITATGVVPKQPSEEYNILYALVYSNVSQNMGDVTSFNVTYSNIQIEVGSTETEYEPYKEGEEITTTLAEGAELTSIVPNMTIYTNKVGAIVECSYNKDTNIVIEKLTQAIIALGGNV